MQRMTVIGNVGREPELRYTNSGQPVCSFSVAENRRWRNANGEQQEETTWFECTAWQRRAEVCNEYLRKGSQVYLEGRIALETYEKRDGTGTAATLKLTVLEMQLLGGRADAGAGANSNRRPAPSNTYSPPAEEINDVDDLPF